MWRNRRRRPATTDAALALPDDADDDAADAGPLRRCVVTRARLPKERMIRFVVGPDRAVVPDLAERLPGRGIWLSARLDVVQTARLRGAFAKAARGPVTVPPDLPEMLQAALVRRISEGLGLARRAGQAIAGFEKARAWLREGRAGLVVQAADGSAEEQARFLSSARAPVTVQSPLSAAALGGVFGRERTVHVVVAPGALAERIGVDCARLAGLAPGAATDDKAADSPAANDAPPDAAGDRDVSVRGGEVPDGRLPDGNAGARSRMPGEVGPDNAGPDDQVGHDDKVRLDDKVGRDDEVGSDHTVGRDDKIDPADLRQRGVRDE